MVNERLAAAMKDPQFSSFSMAEQQEIMRKLGATEEMSRDWGRKLLTDRAVSVAQGRAPEPKRPTTKEEYMALAKSLPEGDPEREKALNMAIRLGEPQAAGRAVAMTGAIPVVGGLVTAPVATVKALAGSAVGAKAGDWIGANVPVIGGEGSYLQKGLRFGGGLAGGFYGTKTPGNTLSDIVEFVMNPGQAIKRGMQAIGTGAETAAAERTAAEAMAARVAALEKKLAERGVSEEIKKKAIADVVNKGEGQKALVDVLTKQAREAAGKPPSFAGFRWVPHNEAVRKNIKWTMLDPAKPRYESIDELLKILVQMRDKGGK